MRLRRSPICNVTVAHAFTKRDMRGLFFRLHSLGNYKSQCEPSSKTLCALRYTRARFQKAAARVSQVCARFDVGI
jgi:hypothetical protein